MNVEMMKQEGATATLKGRGEVENQQSIVATLVLEGFCLRDCNPDWSDRDERLVRALKSHFEWLTGDCGRRPIADWHRFSIEMHQHASICKSDGAGHRWQPRHRTADRTFARIWWGKSSVCVSRQQRGRRKSGLPK